MRKQFIITVDNGKPGYDDWDGLDCWNVKDGVADWTGFKPGDITVEEIERVEGRSNAPAMTTELRYTTLDVT